MNEEHASTPSSADPETWKGLRTHAVTISGRSAGRYKPWRRSVDVYGLDGESWTSVPGVYQGHATELKEVRFSDGDVVRARYVRLIVKSWENHVSLRADVLISNDVKPHVT